MFKAAKASNCDLGKIRFPVVAEAKLDGVNGTIFNGGCTSREGKPFKNSVVTDFFSHPSLHGFNGEFAVGSLTDGATCRRTSSVVNSYSWNSSGEIPDLYVFDLVNDQTHFLGYGARLERTEERLIQLPMFIQQKVRIVPHFKICNTVEEVLEFHGMVVALGFEGTVLRYLYSPHKNGRYTVKEGGFLRLKDEETGEARVIQFIEAMENQNPQLINVLGEAYRTSHKENLVEKGMVGSFLCDWQGIQIQVSAGQLTHDERRDIWEGQGLVSVGDIITFRYMKYGMLNKPRFARYVTRRNDNE